MNALRRIDRGARALLCLTALGAGAGCGGGKSGIFLTATTAEDLCGLTHILVVVENMGPSASADYEYTPPAILHSYEKLTFGFWLPPERKGKVTVTVKVTDKDGKPVADGSAGGVVEPGSRTDVAVPLSRRNAPCPAGGA